MEERRRRENKKKKKHKSSMAKHTSSRSLVFSSCSILMASLFAYSASVQLDDPDWYLWMPLYALAAAVNLLRISWFASKSIETTARAALLLGSVLFLKVVAEDHTRGTAGFWSLDMRERAAREKLGSGLVAASMFLHLKAPPAASERSPTTMNGRSKSRGGVAAAVAWVDYGMGVLVAVSYGLSYYFFKFAIVEMKKT